MDELLGDFLTETAENLDLLDVELVRFEQEPNNTAMLNTIFQLVHTVKGTRGFLGLPRLAKLAHAAETLMGQYRDGAPVTAEGVTLILESIDRIKQILSELDRHGTEPAGSDADLIAALEVLADGERSPASALESAAHAPILDASDDPVPRPGEVSLAELERAWQTAPGPEADSRHPLAMGNGSADGGAKDGQARSQTVRVSVDTLERLMTTVSELVLTRNQLLELVRRSGESEFKAPLQRLSNVTAELQEGIMKARMQPIANAWQKLPRLVRELSLELGKKIELEMTGGEMELDRQVLELIKDPLTHMLRKLRGPRARGARRASEGRQAGNRTDQTQSFQRGGCIVIEVADDGRELDTRKIRARAAELDRLSDAEIYRFIFRAGFSTANAVTGVSRRGVGMDVVGNNIELIGGTVELVRDVFVPRGLSRVPLAPPEVAGLLNLRGRIVTAIDLRQRLGIEARDDAMTPLAVGIEKHGELYGSIVDQGGDVLRLERSTCEANPVNLDAGWASVCAGVHRLETGLMVVLDVDKVLDLGRFRVAA